MCHFLYCSVTVLPFAADKNRIEWSFEIMQILFFIIVVLASINNSCLLCIFIWCLSDDSYFHSTFCFLRCFIMLSRQASCLSPLSTGTVVGNHLLIFFHHFVLYLSFNLQLWPLGDPFSYLVFPFNMPHTFLIVSVWHHKMFEIPTFIFIFPEL